MKNKRLWKSIIAVVCAVLVVGLMTACSTQVDADASASRNISESGESMNSETVTGKVTSIDGDVITIESGNGAPEMNGTPPDMNSDSDTDGTNSDMPADGQMTEAPADGQMPEAPAEGQMPEAPADGKMSEAPADGQMPEAPADGKMPEAPAGGQMPEATADGQMPEAPADGQMPEPPADGQMPEAPADGQMPQMTNGENGSFGPKGKTVTIDLSKAILTSDSDITSASELKEGDMITVQFDADGNVTAITLSDEGSMPAAPGGAPSGEMQSAPPTQGSDNAPAAQKTESSENTI